MLRAFGRNDIAPCLQAISAVLPNDGRVQSVESVGVDTFVHPLSEFFCQGSLLTKRRIRSQRSTQRYIGVKRCSDRVAGDLGGSETNIERPAAGTPRGHMTGHMTSSYRPIVASQNQAISTRSARIIRTAVAMAIVYDRSRGERRS